MPQIGQFLIKKRNILLIEPGYNNKYPPIGLMKIATYHRLLGDKVVFYKGDVKNFIVEQIYESCLEKICELDGTTEWRKRKNVIKDYIKTKNSNLLNDRILKGVNKNKALSPNGSNITVITTGKRNTWMNQNGTGFMLPPCLPSTGKLP